MSTGDLTPLRVLVALEEHRSMGAAARALGMTQPNVSRTVARAERQWGLRLVDRAPRGSTLTAEGRLAATEAAAVLRAHERFAAKLDRWRAQASAHVTVAASVTVAEYLAPGWLSRLRRSHPDTELQLLVCNTAHVLRRTREGAADIGFIEGPHDLNGLHAATIGDDELVLVVSPRHPWAARREPVDAELVARTALVVREQGSGTRATLEAALARALPPGQTLAAPAMELSSNAAVIGAVRSGVGPAVLSALAVGPHVASGQLVTVEVAGRPLRRKLRAVWKPPLPPDGPLAALVQVAREHSRPGHEPTRSGATAARA